MLFKSISSATYVSLRIALKKIAKKREGEEKKTNYKNRKTLKKMPKTLYDYTILYYNEKLPLKVHSILYDNYIICRASLKQLLCNTFLKIRNTTQQNTTHNTQRRYV